MNLKLLFFLFLGGIQFSNFAYAQSQKGTIISEEALVYQEPDFDAPVVSTLYMGGIFDISTAQKGPFYKIRLKPGYTAWIADNDIKPGIQKDYIRFAEQRKNKKKAEEPAQPAKRVRPFEEQRYKGLLLESMQYAEDTVGRVRTDNLLFYGMKWAGPNTLFDGDMETDANILFHFGAPSFYNITGNSGGGFILMSHFLFLNTNPLNKKTYMFYGFGPMAKFTHYDLVITDSGKDTNYAAEDLNLGAIFNLGMAYRISKISLRTDIKYYWEKQKYFSLGLSLLFEY